MPGSTLPSKASAALFRLPGIPANASSIVWPALPIFSIASPTFWKPGMNFATPPMVAIASKIGPSAPDTLEMSSPRPRSESATNFTIASAAANAQSATAPKNPITFDWFCVTQSARPSRRALIRLNTPEAIGSSATLSVFFSCCQRSDQSAVDWATSSIVTPPCARASLSDWASNAPDRIASSTGP
ncbi:MAG: hypothetical protein HONDAALG_03046 [Gammaproteobacteria bacterium]|nr:hypothetical protein [Gammaproteobacteria bacterium]